MTSNVSVVPGRYSVHGRLRTAGYSIQLPARGGETHKQIVGNSFRPTVSIGGLRFLIVQEEGQIGFVCEEWPSLSAFGRNKEEALDCLIETLADASRAYLNADEDELSDKSKEFAAYLRENLRA